jgi:hypothetical protein
MKIDHNKYPIIIGSTYVNDENQIGTLVSCDMIIEMNNAEITIDMKNKGMFYKLNYDTFCMYWRLLK